MSESTTATRESRGPRTEGGERPPASDRTPRKRPPVVGLVAYYRLRCIALETTVAALEAELDRTERRMEEMRSRYEDILHERDRDNPATFTHPE